MSRDPVEEMRHHIRWRRVWLGIGALAIVVALVAGFTAPDAGWRQAANPWLVAACWWCLVRYSSHRGWIDGATFLAEYAAAKRKAVQE